MHNLVEYYDELNPITEDSMNFIGENLKNYKNPVKILEVGAGSGTLAMTLARAGHDVTGIEMAQSLLDSATLKRRTQLTSIRFFKLSITEMGKYLGKNFYNVMIMLHNRISFAGNRDVIKNFFIDCKQLLSDNGVLILQLYNYGHLRNEQKNPSKKNSIRADLHTSIEFKNDGNATITQSIETGNNRFLPLFENRLIYPLTKNEILTFAKDANFTTIEFYSDFKKSPLTEDSEEIICLLR